MLVVVGVEVGSALVPPSGLGSALSLSALCSHSPTIIRITTRTATTATTHRPQLTIHRRRIIPPHGAVGAPLTDTITPVEQRALAPEPWQRYSADDQLRPLRHRGQRSAVGLRDVTNRDIASIA